MSFDEALECTKVFSVAGKLERVSLATRRPFRAPHHTVSTVGLVGGGVPPRPGELSLAHNGVLFLDEVLEFQRPCLEALRQPLEEKHITITRAKHRVTFPADVMMVMALNPCPCGHLGDPRRTCVCGERQIARYRSRLSGPLIDRIDLHVEVVRLTYNELQESRPGESSEEVRARVEEARARQARRFRGACRGESAEPLRCNSQMRARHIATHCAIDGRAEKLLQRATDRLALSARAVHRVLKVSRTIADLAARADISSAHVAEALRYRGLEWAHPAGGDEEWPGAGLGKKGGGRDDYKQDSERCRV
jgi:magnesium chelatase family protein